MAGKAGCRKKKGMLKMLGATGLGLGVAYLGHSVVSQARGTTRGSAGMNQS